MLDTPILFLVFNRPDTTARVFETIRQAKPRKFFVAGDGPRSDRPGEEEKCARVREIATAVDWECEFKTLFRKENMGCGKAVSSSIDWFFENEEEGIILEDDCLPTQSFFWFCQALLEKYRKDERVMHINGNNFNVPVKKIFQAENINSSYFFCSFAQVWGWATWRKAWEHFDFHINSWPERKKNKVLLKSFPTFFSYYEKSKHFDLVYQGKTDIWDYQWQYAVLDHNGLVVCPSANLVSNIGYGIDATHTKQFEKKRNNLPVFELSFPLKHPRYMIASQSVDKHYVSMMGMDFNLMKIIKQLSKWVIK